MEHSALIDPAKRIGTVTRTTANSVELTLPQALAAKGRRGLAMGAVGDFVFVDCDRGALLGRITEVGVPERQRARLEQQLDTDPVVEPEGRVQLLATISKTTRKVTKGINVQPRVGDGVFLVAGHALSTAVNDALKGDVGNAGRLLTIELGSLAGLPDSDLMVPPEKLFGRHCGVFGATGGGKSWTLSRLINEVSRIGGKAILFDPTGEFAGKIAGARQLAFGEAADDQPLARFPSRFLSELDLHALFTPTGQSQGPTLRSATKSLRMASSLLGSERFTRNTVDGITRVTIHEGQKQFGQVLVDEHGTIIKEAQSRVAYGKAELFLARELAVELCNFDIKALSRQVRNECVRSVAGDDGKKYGPLDNQTIGYCNSLIIRIETFVSSPELACMFSEKGADVTSLIDEFLSDAGTRVLVLSFKKVSFKYNSREILLNTLGRYLLGLARAGRFLKQPLVCFLDEAHQFIGRSVGDEQNSVTLDAFGLIAKEGRKYGLTTVIATQRPRDVPQDVLSQLGTLFVHRLTNDRDRETIEKACGDLDRSAAAFIPSLGQGEAIVVGPDLPAPLPVIMTTPAKSQQPESHGPAYQKYWGTIFD
jgi:DNA helicase HerA-like ATPase|nr:ATP-binding protein [Aminobacter aminovorans]